MAKTVWVKNNDNTRIGATVAMGKDGDDKRSIVFFCEKVDQNTGVVVSRGYTEVDSDVFKKLVETNNVIKAFVDKGVLVAYDEEPDDAVSPAQRAEFYKKQVADLTAKLTAAEGNVTELTNKNAELEKEVESLTAEIVGLKDAAIKAEGTDKGAKAKDTGKGSKVG